MSEKEGVGQGTSTRAPRDLGPDHEVAASKEEQKEERKRNHNVALTDALPPISGGRVSSCVSTAGVSVGVTGGGHTPKTKDTFGYFAQFLPT